MRGGAYLSGLLDAMVIDVGGNLHADRGNFLAFVAAPQKLPGFARSVTRSIVASAPTVSP